MHSHGLKTSEQAGTGQYGFIDFGIPGSGIGQYKTVNETIISGFVFETYNSGGTETRPANTALAPRIVAY